MGAPRHQDDGTAALKTAMLLGGHVRCAASGLMRSCSQSCATSPASGPMGRRYRSASRELSANSCHRKSIVQFSSARLRRVICCLVSGF